MSITRQDLYNQINQEWHPVMNGMSDEDLTFMVSHPKEQWGNILQNAKNILIQKQQQNQQSNILNTNNNIVVTGGVNNSNGMFGGTGVVNTGVVNTGNSSSTARKPHSRHKTPEEKISTIVEAEEVSFDFGDNKGSRGTKPTKKSKDLDFIIMTGEYMDMEKHKTATAKSVTSRTVKAMDKSKLERINEMDDDDSRVEQIVPELNTVHFDPSQHLAHTVDGFSSTSSFIALFEQSLIDTNLKLKKDEIPYDTCEVVTVSLKEMVFTNDKDLKQEFLETLVMTTPFIAFVNKLISLRERYIDDKQQLMANAVDEVLKMMDKYTKISLKLLGDSLTYSNFEEDFLDILLHSDEGDMLEKYVMRIVNVVNHQEEAAGYIKDDVPLVGVPMLSHIVYSTLSHTDLFLSSLDVGDTTVLNTKFHRELIKVIEETHISKSTILTLVTRDGKRFYIAESLGNSGSWRIYRDV